MIADVLSYKRLLYVHESRPPHFFASIQQSHRNITVRLCLFQQFKRLGRVSVIERVGGDGASYNVIHNMNISCVQIQHIVTNIHRYNIIMFTQSTAATFPISCSSWQQPHRCGSHRCCSQRGRIIINHQCLPQLAPVGCNESLRNCLDCFSMCITSLRMLAHR